MKTRNPGRPEWMIYFSTKERRIYPLAKERRIHIHPAKCGKWVDREVVPAIPIGRTVCRMNAALLVVIE